MEDFTEYALERSNGKSHIGFTGYLSILYVFFWVIPGV
jgi:hypothetical protein